MVEERRLARRFILQTPARLLLGPERAPFDGLLINLSEGGLFLTTDAAVSVGDVVFIQFEGPQRTHCEATGKVAHLLPFGDRSGYGISFHIANDALVDFLGNLVARPDAEAVSILDQVDNVVIEIGNVG